ncbi:eukaryotic translation initiation factor 4E-like isoform X2 [Ischnura elegans]|uniref:eukaryotic translation initiation factor 4E-like isoform X2 n=1 Tax=Ischnura elegans TaxID=197161 RepID=UPI001ED88077|nr:eukaryotic translation initiation factor 4E-like isoform X2 [Ischnura elegans]
MACGKTSDSLEIVPKKEEEEVEAIAPDHHLFKHPLQNTWTLWFYENDRSKSWEENQREITSFDTVEDFWGLYNNIKAASDLRVGCDYSLFKKGIRPMWEDDANKRGGRWLVNLEKKRNELTNIWLEVLLCMIGEAFDECSDEVCGAVLNVRSKMDKIGLWTADYSNGPSVKEIGRKLKERLRIGPKVTIGYQIHRDTQTKSSSAAKNTYTC